MQQKRLSALNQWARCVVLLALWAVMGLSGCAVLTPADPKAEQQSMALLEAQFQRVEAQLASQSADAVKQVYVGSAQHSQSLAFQNDVLLMQEKLQGLNPAFASIVLSNQVQMQQLSYPFATASNLQVVFAKLAEWSSQHRLALTLLISTHGSPDVLSVNIGNNYLVPVRTAQLQQWLRSLDPRTAITVVLSACYSGSFADALGGKNRMVLTSAAADRNSFGCSYNSQNTWFIAQLLGPRFQAAKTWESLYRETVAGVEEQEAAQKVARASNPQMRSTTDLKKLRLGEWFSSTKK